MKIESKNITDRIIERIKKKNKKKEEIIEYIKKKKLEKIIEKKILLSVGIEFLLSLSIFIFLLVSNIHLCGVDFLI